MAIKRLAAAPVGTETIDIPNLGAGEHEGRLRYVADLGMQERTPFQKGDPERAPCQQLSLGIEIVGETIEVDGKTLPRLLWSPPFNVFNTMSGLGKELKFFKAFDSSAKEDTVADWDSVLNEPCNVTTVLNEGKGASAGRTFDNIVGIAAIPAKYKAGVEKGIVTDGCTGDCEDDDNPAQSNMYGLPDVLHSRRITSSITEVETVEEMLEDTEAVPF